MAEIIEHLEQIIEDEKQQNSNLDKNHEDLQKEFDDLKEEFENKVEILSEVESEKDKLVSHNIALNQDKEHLTMKLTSEGEKFRNEIQHLQESFNQKINELNNLEEKLEEKESLLKNARNQVKQLESGLKDKEIEYKENLLKHSNEHNIQLSAKETQIVKLSTENSSILKDLEREKSEHQKTEDLIK